MKFDQKTLGMEYGMFARILVHLDLASQLPEKILVERRELNFYVRIEYEKMPEFCINCGIIGHSLSICRKAHIGSIPRDDQQH